MLFSKLHSVYPKIKTDLSTSCLWLHVKPHFFFQLGIRPIQFNNEETVVKNWYIFPWSPQLNRFYLHDVMSSPRSRKTTSIKELSIVISRNVWTLTTLTPSADLDWGTHFTRIAVPDVGKHVENSSATKYGIKCDLFKPVRREKFTPGIKSVTN
jgi:hypothetical protein